MLIWSPLTSIVDTKTVLQNIVFYVPQKKKVI